MNINKFLFLSVFALIISQKLAAQIPSYIPKDSLVGWWPFNGNANDESGKGNNGKVTGAKLTTDRNGNSNQCYSFDGVGDYIDCGSSKSLNPTGNFTVSMWINANNFAPEHGLISNYNNGGGIDLITSADNTIPPLDKIRWMDQGGFLFSTSITSNKWIQLVAVFDANKKEKAIYLDGKLFATGTSTLSTIKSSDINMFIGSHQAAIVNYWSWDGKIDDVCMWNRALNSNEIVNIYNAKNCKLLIITEPQDKGCFSGSIDFNLLTNDTTAKYQWQTNQGTGYVTLNNAGQYNGVTTSTLSLNNASSSNDGQLFRCIATGDCGKDTTREAKLSVWGVGVDQISKLRYSISPNPVKDILNVDGVKLMSEYTIYSVAGKQLLTGIYTVPVDLGSLSSGVYFLSINGQIARFIKE
jgi:hypothetical protein